MDSGCFSSSLPGLYSICAVHRSPSQSASTHQPFLHQNCCELLLGSSQISFIASRAFSSPHRPSASPLRTEMCADRIGFSCSSSSGRVPGSPGAWESLLRRVIHTGPSSLSMLISLFVLFPACQTPTQGLVYAHQAQPAELHSQLRATTFQYKVLEDIFDKRRFL